MINSNFIFIDDDPINNMICRLMTEMVLGKIQSQSFINAEIALEYLTTEFIQEENTPATMLLLDVNMPTMSGWEFLDRVDSLPPTTKNGLDIYILSSSVDERDKERSYANKNVKGFLVKPLGKQDILMMAHKDSKK